MIPKVRPADLSPIVAPTDFSAVSLNAVNYAADMADMIGLNLNLLHVFEIPAPVIEIPVPGVDLSLLEKEATLMLNDLKEKLLARTGGRIAIHTAVRPGNVLTQIISYCKNLEPHAVIMGAEKTSAFERTLFGGKTVEALKHIEWPLIIVPPNAVFRNIRKIGFACDFREVVESVRVKEIKDLVEEFKAELHVIHINEGGGDSYSAKTIEESAFLQELIGNLNPKYHFINEPEIENGISEFAEKNNLDLLIIIPKRHSLLSKIFLRRHSKKLVLHTHVPIMAIHE